jgi:hypothetical protein
VGCGTVTAVSYGVTPDADVAKLARHSTEYQAAYTSTYQREARVNRAKYAFIGGAIGAAVGIGIGLALGFAGLALIKTGSSGSGSGL